MNNLHRTEQAAFHADLNRYFRAGQEADRIAEIKNDYVSQALIDDALFHTLDDDYEIIDRDLVHRMLRNLNDACRGNDKRRQIAMDAITACLNQMMQKLEDACGHEIDQIKR